MDKIKPTGSDTTLLQVTPTSGNTIYTSNEFGGGLYGAGVTITSINYNIFEIATIGFVNPNSGVP